MKWIFDNNISIHLQIVEQFTIFIISNKLEPGSKINSVRDLAVEMKVNPNTVQKALVELESLGLIVTQRTNGKFIAEDAKFIAEYKEKYVARQTKEFVSKMTSIGYTSEQIKNLINGEEN